MTADLFEMARAAHLANDGERAMHLYRRLLEREPQHADAMSNLAGLLQARRQPEAALALMRKAAAVKPDDEQIRYNLAHKLVLARRFLEARNALAGLPYGNPDYDRARGTLAHMQGDFTMALHAYDAILAHHPDDHKTRWDRALTCLSKGDYRAAWKDHDSYLPALKPQLLDKPMPLWRGEPLDGKTLWLYSDQGLGDCIAYNRFIPWLINRFDPAALWLDVNRELLALFERNPFPVGELRALGMEPPAADYHLPLGALMARLDVSVDDLDGYPYLNALPLAEPLLPGNRMQVGICWASGWNTGEGQRRNIPFPELLSLGGHPEIQLYALQAGPQAEDVRRYEAYPVVADLGPMLDTMATTASLLKAMDAFVTCDTALAHLAGSLGVPTIVIVPDECSWLWRAERAGKSVWYNSVEVVRQGPPDVEGRADWHPAIRHARDRLHDMLGF